MKKAVMLLIALMMVSVGFLSGCTDTTSVGIYDDNAFHHQWLVPAVTIMSSNADEAIEAYENSKMENFQEACEILETDALRFLDEINEYDVSPTYKNIWSEFKSALEDFKGVGYYGKGNEEADLNKAYEYVTGGNDGCAYVLELLKAMEE